MIENTRIYEIFRRVLHQFHNGEKLGTFGVCSQGWLRNTEQLFYRDYPSFSVAALSSHTRPDLRASRQNAYQRMFGMDLNHGTDDGQPYPYVRPEAANQEFVSTFEEFLREVWVGMMHLNATVANPTDTMKLATLANRLSDMFRSRRQVGNVSREELFAVSMMSWFHLALETASPPLEVLRDLKADMDGPEQRLFAIGQKVGLPAHGLSKSYLDIAEPMSRILSEIESRIYNDVNNVNALYDKNIISQRPFPPSPEADMRVIITHWSIIAGRDIKARKVATT